MESTLYYKVGEEFIPFPANPKIDLSTSLQMDLTTSMEASYKSHSQSYSYTFTICRRDWDRAFGKLDARTRDPHSSYYIPFYFPLCGSSRNKATKPVSLPTKKVERNVRPKGTHTHRKFYR